MRKIFEPGIYKDIDIEDYHKSTGISNSGLSLILESPAKYYYQYMSGLYTKKDTESKALGSAVHCLVLEPELFSQNFELLPPGFTRHSNANKEYYSSILKAGKKPIKQDEFEEASSMAYAINSNKAFKAILELKGKGNIEHSLFLKHESGITLKSRPDWYCDDLIIDVKTTKCAREDSFSRSVGEFGYHRQAYLSTLVLSKLTGREYNKVLLVAVESEAPYLTSIYLLDLEAINKGKEEVEKAIEIYHECLERNFWPGYPEQIQTINLHRWYKEIAA